MTERATLDALVHAAEREQDRRLPDYVAAARKRFVESGAKPAPRRRAPIVVAAIATLAVAAAIFLFVSRHREPSALATAPELALGVWTDAPEGGGHAKIDGASIGLAPRSRARITAPSAGPRLLELAGGGADLAASAGAPWRISAGPFSVETAGHVSVRWEPHGEVFDLAVMEGTASLDGPGGPSPRAVAAGESVHLVLASAVPTVAPNDAPPKAVVPAPTIAPSAPPTLAPTLAPSASFHPPPPVVDWRDALRRGEYAQAVTDAESIGFDDVCKTASSADLLALGDAARLAARTARAKQSYDGVRARFPGTADAATAAFALGRLAFEARDYAIAVERFEAYLAESPNGPLAREALGRIMESQRGRGDAAGAEAAARRYLARYPDGPHAAYAHGILGE